MRKILLILTLALMQLPAVAQVLANGYYRIQNYKTKRYVYVTDDKGKLNYATTTADMYAIQLWLGFDKASSDPATVCYAQQIDGSKYDIKAQDTGIYEIIQSYVNLRKNNDGTFYAYGSKDGLTKYLGDGEQADCDEGVMSGETSGEYRKWWIKPINTSSDNYFGVKGEIAAGGKYYNAFYAAFPFTFASTGMKAYYITKVDRGMAVMKELTGGVAGETPVIVETSSSQPVNCKLNIGASTAAKPTDNQLVGVYFDNSMKSHYNRVAFNPATMRMLGITSEGKLGYITPALDFIPANHNYLKVPAGTPSELRLVTEQEYNDYIASLAQSITMSQTAATLTEGEQLKLTATVLPAKASSQTLTWASSNTAVATVDATGLVKAIAPGTATITAKTTDGTALTASCAVTVKKRVATSITLSHTQASLVEDSQLKLTATVLPAEVASQALTWTSSNTAVATVDATGLVKAVAPGTATITAKTTDGSNLSATCAVTVTKILATSITLSHTQASLEEDEQLKLTATVLPAKAASQALTWASSNTSVATVDATGLVRAIAPGTATITAKTTDGTALTASCAVTVKKRVATSITLSHTQASLVEDSQLKLTATVLPAEVASQSLTWTSSNTAVATVDATGLVKAIAPGTATITAKTTDGSNLSATCAVTVTKILATSITLSQYTISGDIGSEHQLTATVLPAKAASQPLTWASSNTAVATVNAGGLVTIIAQGEATITATTTDGSNLTASCAVTGIAGIESIFATRGRADIYTITGVLVKRNATLTDARALEPGIYVIGNAKVAITK